MKFCGKEAPHDVYTTDGCIKVTFFNKNNQYSYNGLINPNKVGIRIYAVRRDNIKTSECQSKYSSYRLVYFLFSSI